MRPDLKKVLTEHPRTNSRDKSTRKGYKKRLGREGLDCDKRESIKAMKGDSKEFTDVLGPLRGFLNKNCGRPWNVVFSEICEVLPAKGGVSISHARDHLMDMVCQDVILIDKVPCFRNPPPYRSLLEKNTQHLPIWHDFFVHPDSKVLLRNKHQHKKWRGKRKPPGKGVEKDEYHRYMKDEDGIWYEVTLADLVLGKYHHDVWLNKTFTYNPKYWWSSGNLTKEYGSLKYATAKRQLNHKQIQKLKLNDYE